MLALPRIAGQPGGERDGVVIKKAEVDEGTEVGWAGNKGQFGAASPCLSGNTVP